MRKAFSKVPLSSMPMIYLDLQTNRGAIMRELLTLLILLNLLSMLVN